MGLSRYGLDAACRYLLAAIRGNSQRSRADHVYSNQRMVDSWSVYRLRAVSLLADPAAVQHIFPPNQIVDECDNDSC